MYDETEIAEFRQLIKKAGFSVPKGFDAFSNWELTKICNGWGPDSWPRFFRWLLTKKAGKYAVIALPHDVRFEFKIGTLKEANKEFWKNAKKLWQYYYGWKGVLNLKAVKELLELRACYRILRIASKHAWED